MGQMDYYIMEGLGIMSKRIICIVFFVFIFLLAVFAADETVTTGINLLNEFTYYTTLVKEENSRIGLDSLYDDVLNNYDPQSIDAATNDRMVMLLNTITDLKIIDLQKERLEIIYDYKKSQIIASALPSVFSVIGTVKYLGDAAKSFVEFVEEGGEDMIGGVTSAVQGLGIIASSITSSYYTHNAAKDTLKAEYLKEKYELEYSQMRDINNILTKSLTYQNSYANSNSVDQKYVLNQKLAESFASCIVGDNKGKALDYLMDRRNQYNYFPRYWLELAALYYQNGMYNKCLETIDYYNKYYDYKQIYRKNIRYGQILVYGVSAYLNTCDNTEMIVDKVLPWLEIIQENTADEDWYQRYYCAMVYMNIYGRTGDRGYLKSAYQLIKLNINTLYDRQKELNDAYTNEIKEPSNDEYKQMTSKAEAETKEYYKNLKADQKKLPQMDPSFVSNLKIIIHLIQYFSIGSIDDISYVKDVIFAPQLRAYLTGDKYAEGNLYVYSEKDFGLHMPWLIAFGNSMVLKIPAVFLNDGSKIFFKYDNQEDYVQYWNPQSKEKNVEGIKEVKISNVKRSDNAEKYTVELTFSLTNDMKKIATDRDGFECTVRIVTNDCPIDLFFAGKSAFKCSLVSITKVYDEDNNSFFSSFSEMKW